MKDHLIIRSSSAEFLIFEQQKKEKGIEVRFEDGDLWLTQKALGELYNTSKQDISYHLGNILKDLELEENATCAKIAQVQKEGTRNISYDLLKYRKKNILKDAGKILHKQAVEKANSEYEKFRVKQDNEYISSMDKMLNKYLKESNEKQNGT